MSLVTDLQNATRMVVNISFHFEVKALAQTLSSGDRSVNGICLTKPAGKLEFTLNTSALSIAAIQKSPFNIKFVGQATDQQTVVWTPQLPDPHPTVSVSGFTVTIDSLTGSVTTSLAAVAPPVGADCGGENRAYTLALTSVGANQLEAQAGPGDLPITKLVVNGSAGAVEQVGLKIIQFETNECVGLAVEGRSANFDVAVTGVPQGATVSYQWSVTGGAAAGPSNASLFKVQMPSPPAPVTVTVVVTVHEANRDVVLSTSSFVPVLSNAAAQQIEFMCKLMMEAVPNFPVLPLWDPLRDFVTIPVFEQQLQQVQATAERLSNASQILLRLAASKVGFGSLNPARSEHRGTLGVVNIGGADLNKNLGSLAIGTR